MGTTTRNGEKRERRTVLRIQTKYERAVDPAERADATNGNKVNIGGEVCT